MALIFARVLEPGRAFYIWGGYANLGNYPAPLRQAELYFSQAVVWDKQHPVLTREDLMGAFEICFYRWREGAAHKWHGPTNATDLWHVKKVTPQRMVHLTEKPVELAVRAMEYSSLPGEHVLDLFGGSGSTLIAAQQTHRRAFLMELDPLYCDVIVARREAFTGKKAKRKMSKRCTTARAAAEIGGDEWRARRSSDEDNAEREMRQFIRCVPTAPMSWEEINLAVGELVERTTSPARGIVPKDKRQLTGGIGLGKRLAHWVIVAWGPGATGQVIDYGRISVASDELGTEQAILEALQGFRAQVAAGLPIEGGKRLAAAARSRVRRRGLHDRSRLPLLQGHRSTVHRGRRSRRHAAGPPADVQSSHPHGFCDQVRRSRLPHQSIAGRAAVSGRGRCRPLEDLGAPAAGDTGRSIGC
ncbi:MAG: DNA methyltransferase [Pirellulales bacterium]